MTVLPQTYLTRGHAGCLLAAHLGAVAIVVDALRASTTIAALLDHGVARVLVTAGVDDARALADETPEAILVGERRGERLPGFHLGNSPLEVFSSPRMDGQTAIFTSSNGAQRLVACLPAARTLVGTVANAAAVAVWTRRHAETHGRPVVLVAAGQYPDEAFISPEDDAGCAYLAARIGLPVAPESRADCAVQERQLILHGLDTIFRTSRHARRLAEIGYGDDVTFCARVDTLTSLPVVTGPVMLGAHLIGVEVRPLREEA